MRTLMAAKDCSRPQVECKAGWQNRLSSNTSLAPAVPRQHSAGENKGFRMIGWQSCGNDGDTPARVPPRGRIAHGRQACWRLADAIADAGPADAVAGAARLARIAD